MNANRVLILFAHPLFEKSRVHAALVHAVPRIREVTFHDLYESYPDFNINIRHEQKLLLEHDTVVFQHPFYWYSLPPLMKQWIDMVLEYGWAYGKNGTQLTGKRWINALSTGGPQAAYQPEGRNRFPVRTFLTPVEQTARLCHMEFLPPFVVHGTHRLTENEIDEAAKSYTSLIHRLADGSPVDADTGTNYMNQTVMADGR